MFLAVLSVIAAACGGAATPTTVQAPTGGPALAGVQVEVHETPD